MRTLTAAAVSSLADAVRAEVPVDLEQQTIRALCEDWLRQRKALEKVQQWSDAHIGSGGYEGPDHFAFTDAVFQACRRALSPLPEEKKPS